MSELASFALVAALLTITPGADTMLVLTQGLRSGRGTALACALGVNAGLVVWALVSVVGLSAVLAASPAAYAVLRLAGAGYLVLLGVRALLALRHPARSGPSHAAPSAATAFRRGVVTNLLNPKVGVFYVSLLPQFAPAGHRGPATFATMAAIHLLLSLLWLGGLARAATQAARTLSPRVRSALAATRATVLLGLGLAIAVEPV